MADMVPRAMLDEANNAVQRLKKKLDETTQTGRREMEVALKTMQSQLKTLQAQNKTGEEQFLRSMEREKELRKRLEAAEKATAEGSGPMEKDNEELRRQLAEMRDRQDSSQQALAHGSGLQAEVEELREENKKLLLRLESESGPREAELSKREEETIKSLRFEVEAVRSQLSEETARRGALVSEAVRSESRAVIQQVEEQKEAIETLTEEREQAHMLLSASDEAARQHAAQGAALVKELNAHKRMLAEQQADMTAEASRRRGLEETVRQLEARLEEEQAQVMSLSRRVGEREERLHTLEEERGMDDRVRGKELERLQERAEDLVAQMEEGKAEVFRVQEDAKRSREALRDELRRAEAEAHELREKLRMERERLDGVQSEHEKGVAHMRDVNERALTVAAKREEALQRRCEAAERQVEGLRGTCVPEEALRQRDEEARREKERLKGEIAEAKGDLDREMQRSNNVIERLEVRLSQAEEDAAQSVARQRSLQQQMRQTEKQARRERRQREHAQDQVRAMMGVEEADAKTERPSPSHAGAAGVKTVEAALQQWQKAVDDCLGENGNAASPGSEDHKTALGIVLSETKVESTVGGSPADVCGMFERGDEVLTVNGVTMEDGRMASLALKGEDRVGSVVSIVMRKAATGEVQQVDLPRTRIGWINVRQELMEQLQLLSQDVQRSARMGGGGEVAVSSDLVQQHFEQRVQRVRGLVDAVDAGNLQMQLRLSQQVGCLRQGLEDVGSKGTKATLTVDEAHLTVHKVQEATERMLRVEVAKAHKAIMRRLDTEWDGEEEEEVVEASPEEVQGAEGRLQAQVLELQASIRSLQDEVSGAHFLRRHAAEEAEGLALKLRKANEKEALMRQGSAALRETMSKLEDEIAEIESESLENSVCVAVTIDGCDYDEYVRNSSRRSDMETLLREELCLALEVPKGAVTVLCYCRSGRGIVAEVRLSSVLSSSRSGGVSSMRQAKSLAKELVEQVETNGEVLRGGDYGALISSAVVHGPVSERTAQAMRAAVIERERDARSFESELREAMERLQDGESGRGSQVTELQQQQQAMVVSFQERVRLLGEEHQRELQGRVQQVRDEAKRDLEETTGALISKAAEEVGALEAKYQRTLAESQATIDRLRAEAEGLRRRVLQLESELLSTQSEQDALRSAARAAEQDKARLESACDQVHHMLVPELCSCLATLGNIDGEIGFLNSYHLRALNAADGGNKAESSKAAQQARAQVDKSNQMIIGDVMLLKSQLEALSRLSYVDPFVLSKQLLDANSPSRTGHSNANNSTSSKGMGHEGAVASDSDASSSLHTSNTSPPQPQQQPRVPRAKPAVGAVAADVGESGTRQPSESAQGAGSSARPGGSFSKTKREAMMQANVSGMSGSQSAKAGLMSISQSLEKVGVAADSAQRGGGAYKDGAQSPYTQGLQGGGLGDSSNVGDSSLSTKGNKNDASNNNAGHDQSMAHPPANRTLMLGGDRVGGISSFVSAAVAEMPSGSCVKVVVDEGRGLTMGRGLQEFFLCGSLLHSLTDTTKVVHAASLGDKEGVSNGLLCLKPQLKTPSSVRTATPKWESSFALTSSHVLFPQIQDDAERASVWGQRARSMSSLDGRTVLSLFLSLHELDAGSASLGTCVLRVKPKSSMSEWCPLVDASGKPVTGQDGVKAEVRVKVVYE